MSLQTITLKPDCSMIEVMRRFRAQPDATILKAKHTRAAQGSGCWRIQFIGTQPMIADLLAEEAPVDAGRPWRGTLRDELLGNVAAFTDYN